MFLINPMPIKPCLNCLDKCSCTNLHHLHRCGGAFLCGKCGSAFKTRAHLKGHMFTHFKERMVKEYECYGSTCVMCGHDFGRQYDMLRHMATVHGLAQLYYQEEAGGEGSGRGPVGEADDMQEVEKRTQDKAVVTVEVKEEQKVQYREEERPKDEADEEMGQEDKEHDREEDLSEEKVEKAEKVEEVEGNREGGEYMKQEGQADKVEHVVGGREDRRQGKEERSQDKAMEVAGFKEGRGKDRAPFVEDDEDKAEDKTEDKDECYEPSEPSLNDLYAETAGAAPQVSEELGKDDSDESEGYQPSDDDEDSDYKEGARCGFRASRGARAKAAWGGVKRVEVGAKGEYEKARERNIQEREALLRKLDLKGDLDKLKDDLGIQREKVKTVVTKAKAATPRMRRKAMEKVKEPKSVKVAAPKGKARKMARCEDCDQEVAVTLMKLHHKFYHKPAKAAAWHQPARKSQPKARRGGAAGGGEATFLANMGEREEVLVQTICTQHPHIPNTSPNTRRGNLRITITLPGTHSTSNPGGLHTISSAALLLLHQMARELDTEACGIARVESCKFPGMGLSGDLLACLSSMVVAQARPVERLDTGDITCRTGEEAAACAALLGRCSEWRVVGDLRLPEMVKSCAGEVWSGLAGAAGRGRCHQLVLPYTQLEVGEAVEEVWRSATLVGWVLIGGPGFGWVFRLDLQPPATFQPRVEEGWREVVELHHRRGEGVEEVEEMEEVEELEEGAEVAEGPIIVTNTKAIPGSNTHTTTNPGGLYTMVAAAARVGRVVSQAALRLSLGWW